MFAANCWLGRLLARLTPFLITSFLYCWLAREASKWPVLAVIAKCTPILCLVVFVLLTKTAGYEHARFRRLIVLALCCSALGDAMLVFHEHCLLPAVATFGGAHVLYVSALGWRPLCLSLAVPLYTATLAVAGGLLVPAITHRGTALAVCLYVWVLSTMAWRAIARLQRVATRHNTSRHWQDLSAAMAAILFVCSDFLLGLDMFLGVSHVQTVVMPLYYMSQMAFSLSVFDVRLETLSV